VNRHDRATEPAEPSSSDLSPEEFRRLAHATADWMADYLEGVRSLPVFPDVEPGSIRRRLPTDPPEDGEPMDRVLADFRELIVPGITHWNHPRFFGYFAITASAPGILGEMLASVLNVNAMVWRSSPAATELEEVATDWLRRLLGLPAAFDGVINDTASSSTLYALAAAREVAWPEAHEEGLFGREPGRVYASDQAHSSVEKAVLTLGLGRMGFGAVPSDEAFRMDVGALERRLREDVAAGIRPVAIVATLGTTSSASIDPVSDIADLAAEYGAWLHVDAAYGGPAALVPEVAARFAGWERADSIVVNPHKWLFTPIDCSVLYCRRPEELVRAFSVVPEYLTSTDQASARSLMDYGVSLGRRFRALKLWFVMRAFGRAGLADRIGRHLRLAGALASEVEREDAWEIAAPVHLATVAIRFAPGWDAEDEDEANRRIIERVNRSGDAFLTHTVLAGKTVIRVSIGNLETTEQDVAILWRGLRAAANAVAGERRAPVR
jgi:aromatic-L-amino-acid/L-tryptophan decarboxylase